MSIGTSSKEYLSIDTTWDTPYVSSDSPFNPSSHGPFFPRRLTASGRIEPGSSVHMWPGRETAYPFSPNPPPQLLQGPRHGLYRHNKFQYCFFACHVGNLLHVYIYFFENLKETFEFVLLVAMSRALSLLPSAPSARSELGGAVTWQVLFFLSRVAGFPRPRSHMTCIFGFFYFLQNKNRKASL